MNLWELEYLIISVFAFLLAFAFYRSKNGALRILLIFNYTAIGIMLFLIALNHSIINGAIIDVELVNTVASMPLVISFAMFYHYIKKHRDRDE